MRKATSWRQPQVMTAAILLLALVTPSAWSQTARPATAPAAEPTTGPGPESEQTRERRRQRPKQMPRT